MKQKKEKIIKLTSSELKAIIKEAVKEGVKADRKKRGKKEDRFKQGDDETMRNLKRVAMIMGIGWLGKKIAE